MRPFPLSSTPRASTGDWLSRSALDIFREADTSAHRLCTIPTGWVERFGADVLISYQDEPACETLRAGLESWSAATGFTPQRIFGRFLPKQNAERSAPVLLEGDAAQPLLTTVTEGGVCFGLDFGAGYSAGLFIDQRANRAFLRRAAPHRLLNTFAYTCSFSVVAALAGAETVSIDLSKKSLDRGRENFALNALDPATHRFLAGDVLDALPRLARKNERFDAIILDPPTFSRGAKGRRFQVEHDLEALLLAALELATPNAKFWSPQTARASTAAPSKPSPASLSKPPAAPRIFTPSRHCPTSPPTQARTRSGCCCGEVES